MRGLGPGDAERVRRTVEAVRQRTGGGLGVVIAGSGDAYLYIPLLWASLAALLVPGVVLYLPHQWRWVDAYLGPEAGWGGIELGLDQAGVYALQLLVFLSLGLLFRWPPLKMRLIPRVVKRRRARRLAREQFFARGLHRVPGEGGVLLFVSVAERYIEIVADRGMVEAVDYGSWTAIVDEVARGFREGRPAEGIIAAVESCGALLARQFPALPDGRRAPGGFFAF